MKKTRIVAAALVFCMMLTFTPAFAQNAETKKHIERQLMGDVTLDETLNTGDATFILKWAAGAIEFTEQQEDVADANMDGTVNTADATYILKVAAAMVDEKYREIEVKDSYKVSYVVGLEGVQVISVPVNETVEEESTYRVADAPVIIGEGFKFIGWRSSEDHELYQPGSNFFMPSHDVTFTACYEMAEVDMVTVTLSLYDSFNEIEEGYVDIEVPSTTTAITAKNTTLEGFIFANSSFSQKIEIDEDGNVTPEIIEVDVIPVEDITYLDSITLTHYIIKEQEAFYKIGDNLEASYLLDTDIDLNGEPMEPFGFVANGDSKPFMGAFNGNGYTIEGLYIDCCSTSENYHYSNIGLFAVNCGIICNVSIYTQEFDGESLEYGVFGDENVGVVAGINASIISDCHVYGNVGTLLYDEDEACAGGLVGYNLKDAIIQASSFEGGVEGFFNLGGLVGLDMGGTINQCYFAGSINSGVSDEDCVKYGVKYVGGIAGSAQDTNIVDSYIFGTGDFKGYQAIGGFVGWVNRGTMNNMFLDENVSLYGHKDSTGFLYGYAHNQPTGANVYMIGEENENLPTGFSDKVWSMDGACYEYLPDLINNPRDVDFYNVEY